MIAKVGIWQPQAGESTPEDNFLWREGIKLLDLNSPIQRCSHERSYW